METIDIYCLSNPLNYLDLKGLDSYILYTTTEGSDFSDQAEWREEELKKRGENVIMIPVTSAEDFVNGWESMGTENEDQIINYVEIYSHSQAMGLIFVNGSSTEAINVSGINSKSNEIPKIEDLSNSHAEPKGILQYRNGFYLINGFSPNTIITYPRNIGEENEKDNY